LTINPTPPKNSKFFEDDPILGKFIVHAPIRRAILLIRAGIIYAVVTTVLQIAFASFENTAAIFVLMTSFSLLSFGLGWYVLHLWNREVVLYERGFTYREGSQVTSIQYSEIVAIRQRAERIMFFGVMPRDIYEYTLLTKEDELIKLSNLYRGIDAVGPRLNAAIQKARRPIVDHLLSNGETLVFHDHLNMTSTGLIQAEQTLTWESIDNYRTVAGQLVIFNQPDKAWFTGRLEEIDNLTLLITLLRDHTGKNLQTNRS